MKENDEKKLGRTKRAGLTSLPTHRRPETCIRHSRNKRQGPGSSAPQRTNSEMKKSVEEKYRSSKKTLKCFALKINSEPFYPSFSLRSAKLLYKLEMFLTVWSGQDYYNVWKILLYRVSRTWHTCNVYFVLPISTWFLFSNGVSIFSVSWIAWGESLCKSYVLYMLCTLCILRINKSSALRKIVHAM